MIKAQMQKLSSIIAFFVAGSSFFALSAPVQAANTICPQNDFKVLCNLRLENNPNLFGNVVTILLVIAVILSILFLIWGAIRWITSGGDKAKVDGARQAILAAIVGLIIAFLAFFILNVMTFLFTGKSMTNFSLPTIVP